MLSQEMSMCGKSRNDRIRRFVSNVEEALWDDTSGSVSSSSSISFTWTCHTHAHAHTRAARSVPSVHIFTYVKVMRVKVKRYQRTTCLEPALLMPADHEREILSTRETSADQ